MLTKCGCTMDNATNQFSLTERGVSYEREILIALQGSGENLRGLYAHWVAMAAQIEASPVEWRWWIRRHPLSVMAHAPK